MTRYEVLHYPGNVTDGAPDGSLLGHDEIGRPYAVIDAEYHEFDGIGSTTVHLGYASPEQIRAAMREQIETARQAAKFAMFRPAVTL